MPNLTIKSEIRKAFLANRYVIITPNRALRPKEIKEKTILSRTSACPFCFKNIDKKNIIDEILDNNCRIACIKNIFPAVSLENDKAYGTQEVIIDNHNHNKELADLPEKNIEALLRMYSRRTKALSANKNIEYILCFKNQGPKAGTSIVHAHSQIFATRILPPDVKEELAMAQSYQKEKGHCPYCDEIKKESKSKRKIFSDKHVVAFAPYASEFHYEAWIFSKRHLDNITKLNDKELRSFAKALKLILKKLQKLDLSFNFFLHQIVSNKNQHFYLKIQPRASIWAGVELGSGLIINSVPPESAAEYYRSA